jgi:hypothetical protein
MGRDPIEFEDGMSLYEAFFPIDDADPTGQAVFIPAPAVPIGIGGPALYAAAAAAGVPVTYCLVEPTCLADAKGLARDMLEDFSDLVRPRPKPKPKWDPPYIPNGPKPEPKPANNRDHLCWYEACGDFSIAAGNFATHNCSLSYSESLAISWPDLERKKCNGWCKYECRSPNVDWLPDPVRPGVDQGIITFPGVAVITKCTVTKMSDN